jgi:predicted PurR-regulated permease PerM
LSNTAETRFRFAPVLGATVAVVIMVWLAWRIADLILILFIAVLVSLYLGSVTDFIVERLRIPRRFAFTATVLLTIGAVVGLGALLVPPVVAQTRALIAVLPEYVKAWQEGFQRLVLRFPSLGNLTNPKGQIIDAVVSQLQNATASVLPTVVNIGHQIVNVVSILVMGIYMALYPSLYREWLIALFPPVHRDVVRDVLGEMASTLRAWIAAQAIAMSILGMLTAFGLWVLNVPYWLTFGVFTGAVVIVPFFGTLVGTLLPALFVLGGPGFHGLGPGVHFLLVIMLGVLVHIIEGNLVLPLITAKRVEIPPVLGMMAVLVVARLLGIGGVIVAVPLLAVTMVIVRRVLINRVYEGQSFRRTARDRVLVVRVPATDGGVIVPTETIDVLQPRPAQGATVPAPGAAGAASSR